MTRRSDSGFALVSALWFLALLGLVAVIIESWISAALDRAAALQQRVAAGAASIGATDRTIFLLANGEASPRGVELVTAATTRPANPQAAAPNLPRNTPALALDGRPYSFGGVTLRLQDEGGLYDLSRFSRDSMRALLRGYGVSIAAADRMSAALAVYAKKPADLTARASADAAYARAGLPAPRYARLVTPWELYRVLGWSQADALWRAPSSLADRVTTGPTGGLNINTTSAEVFAALAGLDEQEAERVVASRSRAPMTDLRDLPADIAHGEEQHLQTLPSGTVRLTLTVAGEPLARIVSIRLTPGGTAPYRIDFAVDLPRPAPGASTEPILPLPDLPNAPAEAR